MQELWVCDSKFSASGLGFRAFRTQELGFGLQGPWERSEMYHRRRHTRTPIFPSTPLLTHLSPLCRQLPSRRAAIQHWPEEYVKDCLITQTGSGRTHTESQKHKHNDSNSSDSNNGSDTVEKHNTTNQANVRLEQL